MNMKFQLGSENGEDMEEKSMKYMLVVDDVEINRAVIRIMFEDEYKIIEAENGRQALEALKQYGKQIVIVLLDLLMPEMSGEEFLEAKNKDAEIVNIPVVVISSEGSDVTQLNMLGLGVNDFVTKPFLPEMMERRVNNVLEYQTRFHMLREEYNKK